MNIDGQGLDWIPSSMNPGADNTMRLLQYHADEAFESTTDAEDLLTKLSSGLSIFYQLGEWWGKLWYVAIYNKYALGIIKILPNSDVDVNLDWSDRGSHTNDVLDSHMFSAGEALYMNSFIGKCVDVDTNLDFYMDSGGFQVAVGRRIFLPPDRVIQLMMKVANFGIAADLPSSTEHTDVLFMLARIQKMNNIIFRNHYVDDFKFQFVNVVHGFDLESIRKYADIVKEEGCSRWSIGSARGNYYVLLSAIILIREYGAKHIHFLGKSSWSLLPAMALLSRYVKVTCDSTTHLMAGINAEYIEMLPVDNFDVFYFRRKKLKELHGSPFQLLDFDRGVCKCRVCNLMFNKNLFRYGMGGEANRLLATHNLLALKSVFDGWGDLAKSCPPDVFCTLVKNINKNRESWVNANFVKYAMEDIINYTELGDRYDNEMKYVEEEDNDFLGDLDLWSSVRCDDRQTLIKAMTYRYMLFERKETKFILERAIERGEIMDIFNSDINNLQFILNKYYTDFCLFLRRCLDGYIKENFSKKINLNNMNLDFAELELNAFGDKGFIEKLFSFHMEFDEV